MALAEPILAVIDPDLDPGLSSKPSSSAPDPPSSLPSETPSKPVSKPASQSAARSAKLLVKCPLSTPENICSHCQVIDTERGRIFFCHCGAKPILLPSGRYQNAQHHWRSKMCMQRTTAASGSQPLTKFFIKHPLRLAAEQELAKLAPTIELRCAGLTDETWKRPRAKHAILDCIKHSPTAHHGAPPRHVVLQSLFMDKKEGELTETERAQLRQELKTRSTWVIRRHPDHPAIHAANCEQTVPGRVSDKLKVCTACWELRKDQSLRKAINKRYADTANIKYIPKSLFRLDDFPHQAPSSKNTSDALIDPSFLQHRQSV